MARANLIDVAGPDEVFPEPLRPDPAIALREEGIRFPALKPGPVHGAQFVIEIAGPKSVPAGQAHALMSSEWQNALGRPEVWSMAPSDPAWRPMNVADSGSYDSVALAWDLLGEKGELSSRAASHLVQTAERFAQSVQRRAFPFPAPEEVDGLVRSLRSAQEAFDVGVELYVQGSSAFTEKDVWVACAALGLDLSGEGLFVWRALAWDEPLLSVAPVEEGRVFSLAQVRRGETHEALSVGFSLPRSPDPAAVLERTFAAAAALAQRLGGRPFDDEGHLLDERVKGMLRNNLAAGVRAMKGSGLEPGSAICRKLFVG